MVKFNVPTYLYCVAWDNTVAVANRNGLDGPGIETKLGEGGRDFPHPSRLGPHPTPYTVSKGSLSWMQSGCGMLLTTNPLLGPRLKKD